MTSLTEDELELLRVVSEDLEHIADETSPECSDAQLRRVSVQLRSLLVDDNLRKAWRLLKLEPKSPTIVAPRLRAGSLDPNSFAVAGGGNVGGVHIANAQFIPNRAIGPEEAKRLYEESKNDMEYPYPLSDFKESCAIFTGGKKVKRQQLIQYVANKKGGAHLDHKRKKDDEAYHALDEAIKNNLCFGNGPGGGPGKNAVYLELLSIGQEIANSPDIVRLREALKEVVR